MSVDVVVGGQGGDEGKGLIVEYLSLSKDYDICMRVPSPQAGHSHHYNGKRIGLAMIPGGFVNDKLRLLIGSGGLISLEKLLNEEIPATGLTPARLGIDYDVTIVTPEHKEKERENQHLMNKVGSVGTGVSGCRIEKIMRNPDLKFAKDIPKLKDYLTDTKKEIFGCLELDGNILLEGDHGAKLDLVHGEFPYVTTRIVNASGFLSEAGIGPKNVRNIYVVLKPYTTRVAPGPLEKEIFDEKILNWAHTEGGETGTVSHRARRVGKFEWDNVLEVIKMNSATDLAFTHMDAPDFLWKALGYKNDKEFLNEAEEVLCNNWPYPSISLLSYGPEAKDVKDFVNK